MKKLATVLIVFGLLLASAPTVFANDDAPTTGEITILGSAATLETYPIVMTQTTLTGEDAEDVLLVDDLTPTGHTYPVIGAGYNQSWMVTDPRGTGAGWTATIEASDFIGDSGAAAANSATIPVIGVDQHAGVRMFKMQLPFAGGIVWIDGQCEDGLPNPLDCDESVATKIPTADSDFLSYFELPEVTTEDAATFVQAIEDEGMGQYYLNPQFSLLIPAETYSGHYTSNLTVTLIATAP